MFYSEDQITHIAHLISETRRKQGTFQFDDPSRALHIAKDVLRTFFHAYEEIDTIVRAKISSQKKGIPVGSREWEVLYQKYFREEANKRKM